MSEIVKVALAGLGTVGGGVAKLLIEQSDILYNRTGKKIELIAVSDLDKSKVASLNLPNSVQYYDDALKMIDETTADIVVELIGGADGIAYKICQKALAAGKNFVTANKAMIAHHGNEMAKMAEQSGSEIGFEASVAGGIPIIKSVREGLIGNKINEVYGILNGTCNYILTVMRETGKPFDEVLADAQKLGYAEQDPSFDIDGIDTAHKISILGSLAFSMPIDFDSLSIEGIRHISALDIAFSEELGMRIKLLGVGRKTEKGVSLNVYPCMIPQTSEIAHVDGVFNAVVTEGDFVGHSMFVGRGAGERPTASAVVSDIADIAQNRSVPMFNIRKGTLSELQKISLSERCGEYYVRFEVIDQPGVVADIARILGKESVSISSMIQRGKTGKTVPLMMTLHEAVEAKVQKALNEIEQLSTVTAKPCMIRIERL